jgi:hypothetical protein
MKRIVFFSFVLLLINISCGNPQGPGKESGEEANSDKSNANDYPSKSDTTIDMTSGGGTGPAIYNADTLANKGKETGRAGH